MRGMVVGEGGRSSGVLLYSQSTIVLQRSEMLIPSQLVILGQHRCSLVNYHLSVTFVKKKSILTSHVIIVTRFESSSVAVPRMIILTSHVDTLLCQSIGESLLIMLNRIISDLLKLSVHIRNMHVMYATRC